MPAHNEYPKQRYILQCIDKKVMPFTRLELEYVENEQGERKERFVQKRFDSSVSMDEANDSLERLIKGGRFHRIYANLFYPRGFETFKHPFLNDLLHEGYKIEEGEICLATYHLTGYNEGYYFDTGIKFGEGYAKGKGIKLELRREFSESGSQTLIDWFDSLDKKYSG